MKSMQDKVWELYGAKVGADFKRDLFALINDDSVIEGCMNAFLGNKEQLHKDAYPKLKAFKDKYGIDVPIGMCGVDIGHLDRRIDAIIENPVMRSSWEKKYKNG